MKDDVFDDLADEDVVELANEKTDLAYRQLKGEILTEEEEGRLKWLRKLFEFVRYNRDTYRGCTIALKTAADTLASKEELIGFLERDNAFTWWLRFFEIFKPTCEGLHLTGNVAPFVRFTKATDLVDLTENDLDFVLRLTRRLELDDEIHAFNGDIEAAYRAGDDRKPLEEACAKVIRERSDLTIGHMERQHYATLVKAHAHLGKPAPEDPPEGWEEGDDIAQEARTLHALLKKLRAQLD